MKPAPPRFWPVAIVGAVVAAYAGTLRVPFLLDDLAAIVGNPSIRSLGEVAATFSPPADAGVGGRPLANFSFALSYALSGLAPWGYHLLNVAIHAAAALVLFGLVRRTLELPRLRARWGDAAPGLAGSTAVLWAVHPLQTQTVTYISQRTEGLMALFYLLTVYCFVRGLERPAGRWHVLAWLSCLLGALSKEVIVTAPLLVLLFDRVLVADSFGAALRQRRYFYVALASVWLVVGWLLLDVKTRTVGLGLGVGWGQNMLTQSKAIVHYLALSVWPAPLVFDRGPVFVASFADGWAYVVGLSAVLATVILAAVRRPALGLLGGWFLLILAPTSSVIPIVLSPIAENRVYLPLAAVVVLGVLTLHRVLGRRTARVACGALAVASGLVTLARNRDYRSAQAIWTDTVAKAPRNSRAHDKLAVLLAGQPERRAEALAHFNTALQLAPGYADAHNNLGYFLASQLGQPAEALAHYETALRLKPGLASAHNNLANLLVKLPGRRAEAVAHYEAALRARPDDPEAHNNFAVLLGETPGREADALTHFAAALRANPDYAEAHNNFANLLLRAPGRQAEALAHYEAALRLNPAFAEAHNNLAYLLGSVPGRSAEAVAHYESALRLLPESATIHLNLARELAKSPATRGEAMRHLGLALKIDPNFAAAKEALEQLQRDGK